MMTSLSNIFKTFKTEHTIISYQRYETVLVITKFVGLFLKIKLKIKFPPRNIKAAYQDLLIFASVSRVLVSICMSPLHLDN